MPVDRFVACQSCRRPMPAQSPICPHCGEKQHRGEVRPSAPAEPAAPPAGFTQKVALKLQRGKNWRVRTAEGRWICPFCGAVPEVRLPPEGAVPPEALDRLTEHLSACRSFAPGMEKGLSSNELGLARRRANAVVAAKRLARGQITRKRAWQFWDDEGAWCCPFCAGLTSVSVPHGAQITEATLRDIALHLLECPAYQQGRGAPRREDQLQKSLIIAIRRKRMRAELERILGENPAWRHLDRFGKWVCPNCQTPVFQQEPAAEEALAAALYPKVFEHITRQCPPFQSLIAPAAEDLGAMELNPDERRLVELIRDLFAAVEQAAAPGPPPAAGQAPAADEDLSPPPPSGALEGEIV